MKVIYICDFCLRRGSGKDRATRQKVKALGNKAELLHVISNPFSTKYLRFLVLPFLELTGVALLVFRRPDVLISRGYCGYVSQLIAKALGIVSVREVHSNASEELSLLRVEGFKAKVIQALGHVSERADIFADLRIFNHPNLLAWWQKSSKTKNNDFSVYNGFDKSSRSLMSKSAARSKFGIGQNEKIIVFIGSASKWHGVEYLVDLQRCFNEHRDDIQVIFGGGDISSLDPEGICLNLSPLNEQDCADLIKASDFCALPVRNNRVSPGSPLKLYDYIVNQGWVLAQKGVLGYEDEVLKYGIGLPVDFLDSENARAEIVHAFTNFDQRIKYPTCPVSWEDRMTEWVEGIKDYRSKKDKTRHC